jgi:hypothetical protein
MTQSSQSEHQALPKAKSQRNFLQPSGALSCHRHRPKHTYIETTSATIRGFTMRRFRKGAGKTAQARGKWIRRNGDINE